MDEVDEVDGLGPVDWIVVEFPGSKFNGQIVPALLDLVERDLVRVLDLLVLKKDADGTLVGVDDRQAADAVRAHDRERVRERPRGRDGQRVDDDAALRLLDAVDLASLILDRQVLVDEPDAAFAGHANRGRRLGDGVHRRADQWHAQRDRGRQSRRDIDVARNHLAVRRDQQDVVEGERFPKRFLEHGAP